MPRWKRLRLAEAAHQGHPRAPRPRGNFHVSSARPPCGKPGACPARRRGRDPHAGRRHARRPAVASAPAETDCSSGCGWHRRHARARCRAGDGTVAGRPAHGGEPGGCQRHPGHGGGGQGAGRRLHGGHGGRGPRGYQSGPVSEAALQRRARLHRYRAGGRHHFGAGSAGGAAGEDAEGPDRAGEEAPLGTLLFLVRVGLDAALFATMAGIDSGTYRTRVRRPGARRCSAARFR